MTNSKFPQDNQDKNQFNNNIIQALTRNWGYENGRARCPGHNGKDKNLAVNVTANDVLMYCHSYQCEYSQIIEGLGIQREFSHKDIKKQSSHARPTHYPYMTKTGKVVYNVRLDLYDRAGNYLDKEFKTRPTGIKEKILPYGLKPDTQIDPEEILVICEGEKAAHSIREAGFGAITNIGGSNAHNRTDWSILADHSNLVIWPDNDLAGIKWKSALVKILIKLKCTYRVIEVKQDIRKGDAADLSIELIQTRIDQARNEKIEDNLEVFSMTQLDAIGHEKIDWLVEETITQGGLFAIVAKPKCGKSTAIRQLAVAVSNGADWLERKTTPAKTLYLGFEDGIKFSKPHLIRMAKGGLSAYNDNFFARFDMPVLEEHDLANIIVWLEELITSKELKLCCIDSLGFLVPIQDQNNYNELLGILKQLKSLADRTGCCIGITLHAKKGETEDSRDAVLGSTALVGTLESTILFHRQNNKTTIESIQRGGDQFEPSTLEFHKDNQIFTFVGAKAEINKQLIDTKVELFLKSALLEGKGRFYHKLNTLLELKKAKKLVEELESQNINLDAVFLLPELVELLPHSREQISLSLKRLIKQNTAHKFGAGKSGYPNGFIYTEPPKSAYF